MGSGPLILIRVQYILGDFRRRLWIVTYHSCSLSVLCYLPLVLSRKFLPHYRAAWTQWDVPPPLGLAPVRSWTAERHLSFVSRNNGTVIQPHSSHTFTKSRFLTGHTFRFLRLQKVSTQLRTVHFRLFIFVEG